MKLLWKLRFILQEYWRQYLLAFVCLQLVSALNLISPWLIGEVIDDIKDKSLTSEQLILYVAGIIISSLLMYGLRYVWRTNLYGASIELIRKQRSRLFAHFTQLSPAFYQKHTTGDLMAHATNDLNAVEESAGVGIMTLVDSLISGFTVLFAMIFVVSGKLTLLAMLPFPALIWVTNRYGAALHRRFTTAQEAFSNLSEETRESMTGIRAVNAHQLEARQQARFEQLSLKTVQANTSVARIDALFAPSITLFFGLSFVITLVAGAWFIEQGQLSIGLLTSFTLYLGQILWPMLQFGWQFNVFQRGSASWSRLEKLFHQQPEVTDSPNAQPAPDDLSLSLNIQSFTYPLVTPLDDVDDKQQKPVLDKIVAQIRAGAFVGITGVTGSGKSTLLRLILREFDLQEGVITLGDVPLTDLQLVSLRQKLAWVPQEPILFSGTIADNIRFARPNADLDKVKAAARLAAIDEDIDRLKEGYDTLLGENGINLSGGQKQRVMLARALLSDAPVLLLDDAFSALDMKTEAIILRNLLAMKGDKTIILVTQRLPELIQADHILVLDHGRIIEKGNHRQLMKEEIHDESTGRGWYAQIFRQQARTLHQQDLLAPAATTTPPRLT